MTGRVDEHPDVGLRLVLGDAGAEGDGVRGRLLEVVDQEVEVQHHLLVTGSARPPRRHVRRLAGERQGRATRGGLQCHPVRLVGADRSAEQADVEVGELVGVGAVEDDLRQLERAAGPCDATVAAAIVIPVVTRRLAAERR